MSRAFFTRTAPAALCAALLCMAPLHTSFAQTLNPTGRDVSLNVPLRERGRILGDVILHLSADDRVEVEAESVVTLLKPILDQDAAWRLLASANKQGRIGPANFEALGYRLDYDPGELSLAITTPGSARATETLSLFRNRAERPQIGDKPEDISFYTNIQASLDFDDDEIADALNDSLNFRFDSALAVPQLDHAVLEATASVNAEGEFDFGSARAVYDQPEKDRRWRFGQVSSPSLGIEGSENAVALQVASGEVRLGRQDVALATGSTSFTIERESELRVLVNGAITQRFLLQPGKFDIRDFPIGDGLNRIVVEIEDDTGRRQILDFETFRDRRLRAVGDSDYAVTLGVLEETGEDDFDLAEPFVAAFYEAGVTDRITSGAYAKASTEAQVIGSVATISAFGALFDLEVANSHADVGFGTYAAAGVSRTWFDEEGTTGSARAFNFDLSYRTEDFNTSLISPTGQTGFAFDVSASYAQSFRDWRFNIGADAQLDSYSGQENSYSVRTGLGRSFGRFAVSADLGYEFGDEEEAFGFLRASYRIDDLSSVDASYTLREQQFDTTYRRRSERSGVGAWNAAATVGYDFDDENADIGGSFSYLGNRGIARVSHDIGLEEFGSGETIQRTSLDVETSIAVVGGKIGVGRPINDSFALVSGHPNLEGAPVYVNPFEDEYLARSGALGAGVANGLRGFTDQFVSYDVDEAPLGYDLGTGNFTLNPTYRSGYALQVGSAYAVTAIGTAVDARGEPVALAIGEARSLDDEDAPIVTVFTNRIGRFAMQGVGPGRWEITLRGERALRFIVTIAEEATGLVRLDRIQPEEEK